MQVQLLSLAHLLYKPAKVTMMKHARTMTNDQSKPNPAHTDDQQQPSEDFQRFDDVAGKLFKVPVREIKDLEEKNNVERS